MPSAEYLELEIGSDLPVGGGPQEYYGKVVKSPVGEAPKSRLKFWFSAPGVLAKLRGELENAVLEIDDKSHSGLATRGEQVLRDFGRGVFRSVFTEVPSIQISISRARANPTTSGSSCASRQRSLPGCRGNISSTKMTSPASSVSRDRSCGISTRWVPWDGWASRVRCAFSA